MLEQMREAGLIDLYYGDECQVSLNSVVPYAWQFKGEDVFMPSSQSKGLNCFGLMTKDNQLIFETSTQSINAAFIVEQFDRLSLNIQKETVVILDNAKPHTANAIQERRSIWQKRGLTLFFFPPYSPQLNLAEILWRKLKYEWLCPSDYLSFEQLRYAVTLALAAFGSLLNIGFIPAHHA